MRGFFGGEGLPVLSLKGQVNINWSRAGIGTAILDACRTGCEEHDVIDVERAKGKCQGIRQEEKNVVSTI